MRSHSKHKIIDHQVISININDKDGLQRLILRCCELLLVDKIDCLFYLETSLTTLNLEHVFRFLDFHKIPGKFKHDAEGIFELSILCPVKEIKNTNHKVTGVKSIRKKSNEIGSSSLFND